MYYTSTADVLYLPSAGIAAGIEVWELLKDLIADLISWLQDGAVEQLQKAVKACVEGGVEVFEVIWEW